MEAPPGSATNRVGRYHLVERLAVGGMAELFLACERGENALDRLLVIKRILPTYAEQESFVQMFVHEAKLAAKINHPNVVQIYELGESGGFPFIAMEYVPGSTLKELNTAAFEAETRIPLGAVVHMIAQACAGVHAAHELRSPDGALLNLVHRDLSPHNLMVTDDALVKLLDFGIAKAEMGGEATRTGMLKGKVSYMSPEQCRQGKLDRRSDTYAMGFVLWEMLAGQKMFQGMGELATMQAIVTDKLKPLREYRKDIPNALHRVVEKALTSDLTGRYQTADAMRRDLLEAASQNGIEVDADKTGRLVRTLLGSVHNARKTQVAAALERTLVTLSRVSDLPDDLVLPPVIHTSTQSQTRTRAPTVAAAAGGAAVVSFLLVPAAAMITAVAGTWWLGIGPFQTSPGQLPPEVVPPGAPVHITLAPTIGPDQLLTDLEPLRRHLQAAVGRPLQFEVAGSYRTASLAVSTDQTDYALLPYNTLMATLKISPDLDVMATEVVDGSSSSDGYLIVSRATSAQSVEELKGSTLCYTDKLSSTGYKFPRAYIRRQGLDPDVDFEAHFSGDHQQVLRDLIRGTCKVGGTYSGNYSTATQAGIPVAQLRILVPLTGSTPHDGWVASHRADPEVTERMRKALLTFDPVEHLGQQRLGEKKRITGYVEPKASWLEPTP